MKNVDLAGEITLRTFAWATSVTSGSASIAIGSWAVDLFGVPLSVLLAGFSGSIIALSVLPPMARQAVVGVVATGTLTAAFGVKLFTSNSDTQAAWAFFIGLGAHFVLTLALARLPSTIEKIMEVIPEIIKKRGGGQ